MTRLNSYTIPHVGLKKEVHTFKYQLDEQFFKKVETSLIQKGNIDVTVTFDKSKTPYIIDFDLSGEVLAECDRCASDFMVPIEGNFRVYVKFDVGIEEAQDEDLEILFMNPDDPEIDLEPYLYDFVSLSIPYSKVCEDAGIQCDPEVIQLLSKEEEKEETETKPDPRWEGLNKLKDLN